MLPGAVVPTVAIHVVRGAFVEAASRGADPAALAARFGLTAAQLADPDARAGADVMRRIWTELPELVGAADFGLAVARRVEVLHVVGYLARAATTVGDGMRLALRYQRLVQTGVTANWTDHRNAVRIALDDRDPRYRLPRHATEFGVAAALYLVRSATGHELAPISIGFHHPRPADDSEARRVFRCRLGYAAPVTTIEIRRGDFDLPQRTSDPHLAAVLERHARDLDARLPADDSYTSRVGRAVDGRLATGAIDLSSIAAVLGVSPRTAQRRLRDEGTSHQRIVDDLRRELALRHLEAGTLGVQQIAFLLGFSDQSAFNHAFRRWTGKAPGSFRRRTNRE